MVQGSEAGLKVGGAPTVLKCLINMPLGGPAGTEDLNDGSEPIGASVGAQTRSVKWKETNILQVLAYSSAVA
jgi:hypothetical protein